MTQVALNLNDTSFECQICFDTFTEDNRVLPCQHTFCYSCLLDLKKSSSEMKCPTCRVLLPANVDLKGLPRNYFLNEVLNQARRQKEAAAAAPVPIAKAKEVDDEEDEELQLAMRLSLADFQQEQNQILAATSMLRNSAGSKKDSLAAYASLEQQFFRERNNQQTSTVDSGQVVQPPTHQFVSSVMDDSVSARDYLRNDVNQTAARATNPPFIVAPAPSFSIAPAPSAAVASTPSGPPRALSLSFSVPPALLISAEKTTSVAAAPSPSVATAPAPSVTSVQVPKVGITSKTSFAIPATPSFTIASVPVNPALFPPAAVAPIPSVNVATAPPVACASAPSVDGGSHQSLTTNFLGLDITLKDEFYKLSKLNNKGKTAIASMSEIKKVDWDDSLSTVSIIGTNMDALNVAKSVLVRGMYIFYVPQDSVKHVIGKQKRNLKEIVENCNLCSLELDDRVPQETGKTSFLVVGASIDVAMASQAVAKLLYRIKKDYPQQEEGAAQSSKPEKQGPPRASRNKGNPNSFGRRTPRRR